MADAVVTISLTDKKSILRYDANKELGNSGKIFVIPFVASPWETQDLTSIPSFHLRQGLIFVGSNENKMIIHIIILLSYVLYLYFNFSYGSMIYRKYG